MNRILTFLVTLLTSATTFAQFAPKQLVTWSSHVERAEGAVCKVIFTGKIAEGYHTYTLTDELSATEIMDVKSVDCKPVGKPYELSTPKEETDEFGDLSKHYYNEIIIAQNLKITGEKPVFFLLGFGNVSSTALKGRTYRQRKLRRFVRLERR